MDFAAQNEFYRRQVDACLSESFPQTDASAGGLVVEAARYSLLAGGKRLRPILLLVTTAMLGGHPDDVLPFAAAIEMIHTYSLIHDDLPCMDNDNLRRGKPTNHIVYGEAIALLAGDALLNRAFELVHETGEHFGSAGWKAAQILSHASGSQGMIGGQTLDLLAEKQNIDAQGLTEIHQRKTGLLIQAPILMAAALMNATDDQVKLLTQYAEAIGLAFQIRDDILDVIADSTQLGKTPGKDIRDQKTTYVSFFGLAGAQNRLEVSIESARSAATELQATGSDCGYFIGLADYLIIRQS
jgi:geranylgeranyl diphosphate synthase type II